MNLFSLYDKPSSFSGIYVFFLVNRLQMLYFLFIMPTILTHPYMIWGIILVGMLSQLNLMVLSKWVSSDYASKGYQGFVQIFRESLVRLFTFFGVILMLVKVVVLSYIRLRGNYPSTCVSIDECKLVGCIYNGDLLLCSITRNE
ncbi:hypothetical protein ACFRH9_22485 [Peribacillus butanolivorans]|uniref:hypothetical protein n=1 Tax=Peribacillus butanolivorans TaxID=421767 RepID=UPI00366B8D23